MEYNIERWDAIITCNNLPKPMIYFKPDLQIMDFARKNNYNFSVQILESNSPYDNQPFYAVMDKSSMLPNCRPNFFNKTGYFVLTLDSTWNGYPMKNGKFKLLTDTLSTYVPENKNYSENRPIFSKKNKLNSNDLVIIWVMLAVLIFLALVFMFKIKGKRRR